MAESSLTLALEDLRIAVARAMSYAVHSSSAYSGLASEKKTEVDAIVARGIRQFLVPPPLPGERTSHRWSFLVRPATLTLNAQSAPTDTVTVVSGVGTMSGGTLATWIASGVVQFDGAGPHYHVASRDSSTQFTLEDTSVSKSAGTTVVFRQSIADLPDDFGGIATPMTVGIGTGNRELRQVNEAFLRTVQQGDGANSGAPLMFAVRPRTWPSSTTASTRWEAMFWPFPDSATVLDYVYTTDVNYPTGATYYPVGGLSHSETILASCLAIAEDYDNSRAPRYAGNGGLFMQRLMASVLRDRANNVGLVGYNTDGDARMGRWSPRPRGGSVTYNGQTY